VFVAIVAVSQKKRSALAKWLKTCYNRGTINNFSMKKVTKNLLSMLLGSTVIGSLIDPVTDRVQGVIGNTLTQIRETSTGFTKRLIEMVVVAALGFVGIVFVLMGLALFLESQVDVPGSGLAYVGIGILLFSLLTLLIMRYHKE
jgi:hypothetical protein